MHYEKLTENRKIFINQLLQLVNSTFGDQSENKRIKTISIDAPWGMGKSLIKDVLIEKLEEKEIKALAINAWETDYFNDPMKSLIGEINESNLNISSETIETGKELLKNVRTLITKVLSSVLLKKLKFSDEDIENIKSLLKGIDSSGIEDYIRYKKLVQTFKKSFEIGATTPKRIIIVDELDRCKPNYAIEMLESIKHIFDIFNLTFIFLINKNQLECTVQNLYGCGSLKEDYFEKFFDIQLKLPEIDIKDFINIEYENYKYELSNLEENGSLNFEKFMIALFFQVFKEKYCHLQIKSVRQLRKSLNKFNYLIKTFTEAEKRSFLLITGFITFFIYKEFYSEIIKKNNLYGFEITSFFENIFIDKNATGGHVVGNSHQYYNHKCLFNIRAIHSFYKFENNRYDYNPFSTFGSKLKDFNLSSINIYCKSGDPFNYDKNFFLLPLPEEFLKKYKEKSIYEWCKEKYEFTFHLL
ncbi:P-loop NTPase fold protein [Fusobacterium sp. MFO224]|uniref:KAP family P-loop NTPase fold protein n=1 Tax=Fusobacterium sp. MFO224 TaxID=3378070 RepID=UPI00385504CA